MKRILAVVAIVLGVSLPLTASAAALGLGQQYSLSLQQVISGNAYAAAGTVTIGGDVRGDLVAAGGTISVTGSIGDDVAIAGGTVQLLGIVGGDARILGGTVTISDRIGGDVVLLGGSVHVLPGAVIGGDVIVAGGQLVLDGDVRGALTYRGGTLLMNGDIGGAVDARIQDQITLGPSARLAGNFTYRSSHEAVFNAGSRVIGTTSYQPSGQMEIQSELPSRVMWSVVGILTGMKLFAVLGLVAVLVWRWRRECTEVLASIRGSFLQSIGRGLAFGVLVPLSVLLLFISFVGILPGALVMMAFIAMIIITKALTGMLFGSWVVMMYRKRDVLHITWGSALVGSIALALVSQIPVIGWIVSMALWLAVFGALGARVQRMV